MAAQFTLALSSAGATANAGGPRPLISEGLSSNGSSSKYQTSPQRKCQVDQGLQRVGVLGLSPRCIKKSPASLLMDGGCRLALLRNGEKNTMHLVCPKKPQLHRKDGDSGGHDALVCAPRDRLPKQRFGSNVRDVGAGDTDYDL